MLNTEFGALHLGVQAGVHTIPNRYQTITYDAYSRSSYDSDYADADQTFIGFHLKMMWPSLWTEMTFDFSSVERETSSYEYTESMELIKFGLSLGTAF